MKIVRTYTYNERRPLNEQIRMLQLEVAKLYTVLQGRISFGRANDGDRGQNLRGEFQQFTSNVSANTEFSVAHTLDATPTGAIVFWQDKAGSLYQGPTTGTNWDADNVYFKCDVASVTFKVFLTIE